jgi:hypothetical protein
MGEVIGNRFLRFWGSTYHGSYQEHLRADFLTSDEKNHL